ncbi:MAG: hypothetical protein M3R50_03455 [Bacteroidota bacterium]|nr:hypothetical protein [Bacteroidota bacterium]
MSIALHKPKYLASALTSLFAFKKASIANSLTDSINIFLTVDQASISEHFNQNDPAPLYKRQLSHQFQQYITTSVESAKRYSAFYYKINCKTAMDKQYVDAFVYAIRRHFSNKKLIKIAQFEKFKKRGYVLLLASLTVVMICHGIVPMILSEEVGFSSALRNGLDIFSWVILWQPIDKLVFEWNPHLKEISIMDRLATAEIIITENA